jgi:hypothetical protein
MFDFLFKCFCSFAAELGKKHFKELYKLVILWKSVLNLMVLPLSFVFSLKELRVIKTYFFVCTKLMA